MNDLEDTSTGGVSRRTVTKAMAWAVPAVAVAASAPMAAASVIPPVINFGGACGNTGSTGKGCGGVKTLQVPLTLSNNSGKDVAFVIDSMFTCNCATAPTASGAGVVSGVRGIWSTPAGFGSHNSCTAVPSASCGGSASVVVPNGRTGLTFWIESAEGLDNSSLFSTTINWKILDPVTCAVLSQGQAQTATAIQQQNCG